MDANRRFTENEVARIFERAATSEELGPRTPAPPDGLTLAQLHEIGREVGIPPDQITRAATAITAYREPVATVTDTLLGAPVAVGRTVDLPRRLTDEEWNRLIVDLRETFDARGQISEQGQFRQWTNGNLHALLEPAEEGERLRLATRKGSAMETLRMGAGFLAATPLPLLIASMVNEPRLAVMSGFFAVLGIGFYGSNWFQLPRWVKTRQRQMDAVAARLTAAIAGSDSASSDEPPD